MLINWGIAAGVFLAAVPVPAAEPTVSVMTWNACGGTNSACPLYQAGVHQLAWTAARYAVGGSIKAEVVFLQEFCTGASKPLEQALEEQTGQPWSVGEWGLSTAEGKPYSCHPDYQGRDRGVQSVTVAVMGDGVAFQ